MANSGLNTNISHQHVDTAIVLSDETTKNVTNLVHGFIPKVGVAGTVPISSGTGSLWVPSNYGRNVLINGNFFSGGWQRGTSLSAGTGGYLADRWITGASGATIASSQQSFTVGQTDVPYEPQFYHQCVVVAGSGSGDYANVGQKIPDVRTYSGQATTLSFYAKADSPKNICVEFVQNFGTGGSTTVSSNQTTCVLTSSWQKFAINATMPSISGKTIGSTIGFIRPSFWLDAGTTYNTQSNTLGHQSITFDLAQVQWELGSVATPFEQRPYAVEQALCFRHYMKLGGRGDSIRMIAYGAAGGNIGYSYSLPVRMYTTPTAAIVGTWTMTNATDMAASAPSPDDVFLYCTVTNTGTAGFKCADATTYLTLTAEI